MPDELRSRSPRLLALERELAAGGASALNAFWSEIGERGTPLIEALDDAPDRRLVTFLWRRNEPAENVVVVQLLESADFESMRLTGLGASDVWFKSYFVRSDVRTVYQLAVNDSLVSFRDETDWARRIEGWFSDPLNPRRFAELHSMGGQDGPRRDMSVLEMPDAAPMPWVERRDSTPAGAVEQQRFASTLQGDERDIWIYTPPGHNTSGDRYGLLVLFDGDAAVNTLNTPGLLDGLLAAGAIPPLVAVMVGAIDRNVELPCNELFARLIAEELVPSMHERYHVSDDPARAIVGGQSYGGLAAAWCGLRHPDVFGNVLSQSGSFWWKPDPFEQECPAIAGDAFDYEWLTREVVAAPPAPVRFYLDAGRLEGKVLGNSPSLLHSNRHMRDVLLSKGYAVDYREFAGGHDYLWWRSTLADGLLSLTRAR